MLQQILRHYVAATGRIVSAEAVMGGFSGAGVHRAVCDHGAFAVRRWPGRGLPVARIRGLHALLAHVHSCGVRTVAVPLASADGSTLVEQAGEMWQVEPWLSGAADFTRNPTPIRLESAMAALAGWHLAAARFRSDAAGPWFDRHAACPSPAVGERLKTIRWWLANGLRRLRGLVPRSSDVFHQTAAEIVDGIEPLTHRVGGQLERLRQDLFPIQPCLRDIWHDHVLFDGDNVSGIIDPSAARAENVATDLARLLGSLVADDQEQRCMAVAAYRAVAPLSDSEERLMNVLDEAAVVLSPLVWLKRRYMDRSAYDWNAVLPRILRQHKRLCCRWNMI